MSLVPEDVSVLIEPVRKMLDDLNLWGVFPVGKDLEATADEAEGFVGRWEVFTPGESRDSVPGRPYVWFNVSAQFAEFVDDETGNPQGRGDAVILEIGVLVAPHEGETQREAWHRASTVAENVIDPRKLSTQAGFGLMSLEACERTPGLAEDVWLALRTAPIVDYRDWETLVAAARTTLASTAAGFVQCVQSVLTILVSAPTPLDAGLLTFPPDVAGCLIKSSGSTPARKMAQGLTTSVLQALRYAIGGPFAAARMPEAYPKRTSSKSDQYSWHSISMGECSVTVHYVLDGAAPTLSAKFMIKCKTGNLVELLYSEYVALSAAWKKVGWIEERQSHNRKQRSPKKANWVEFRALLATQQAGKDLTVDPDDIRTIAMLIRPLAMAIAKRKISADRERYARLARSLSSAQASDGGEGVAVDSIVERQEVVEALLAALLTRPLVLLAGVSGTGKTQLACRVGRAWAEWAPTWLSDFDPAKPFVTQALNWLKDEALIEELGGGWLSVHPFPEQVAVGVDPDADEVDDANDYEENRDSDDNDEGIVDDEGEVDGTDADEEEEDDPPTDIEPGRRFAFVPVHADWQESAQLWGWYQPLESGRVFHASAATRLLLAATRDDAASHVLVLDEMNLSRIEHYGSDLLSAMERPVRRGSERADRELIELHHAGDQVSTPGGERVPQRVGWPAGMRVIGTVNVDETTFSFAPKVLDRAAVLEFTDVDLERVFKLWGRSEQYDRVAPWFASVQEILEPAALHLGYRAAKEVVDNVTAHLGQDATNWGDDALQTQLDFQFRNKVLPRVRGARGTAEPVLNALRELAVHGEGNWRQAFEKGDVPDPESNRYPRALAKVEQMLARLRATGFTGFF